MSPLVTFQLECVFICSANPGGNYTASGTGNPQYHHARPPPSPRQVPFSYCQRPFGLKTTTRSCHTTSHPAGHSIRRHPERLGWPTWARTRDTLINSQVLYQLSYRPIYGGVDGTRTRDPLRDRQVI